MRKCSSILDNYTEEIKELYLNSTLSLQKIAERYNVSRESITNFAKRNNWYGLRKDASKAIYSVNVNYFDNIDSANKAYWLGFIAADGNIRQDYLRLSIELSITDKEHLFKFQHDIDTNAPIKDSTREHSSSYIRINNKHICLALSKYGIVPNKSLSLMIKTEFLPHQFIRDFIRGYFDGDGSIYQDVRGQWGINFTGSHSFMLQLQEMLPVYMGFYNKGNYSSLETQDKKKIQELIKYIYTDATVYLERKYQKACQFYKPSTTTKG